MGRHVENWGMKYGPIDLLIIQASPFCNIDCTYCYLPKRDSRERITVETVLAAVARVLEAGIVHQSFTIVWHAGEPLAVPIHFYEEVFKKIHQITPPGVVIRHTFQTNAILLNEHWVELIRHFKVRVGVSIDGPAFIHDKQRLNRQGEGTFARVMRGVNLLRKHSVDFYTISVLTDFSLSFPDEVFEFFTQENFTRVGFNLEETEGFNRESTLHKTDQFGRVKTFFKRFYQLYRARKPTFVVREFSQLEYLISSGRFRNMQSGQQLTPLRVVSVDSFGGFSTFAPELLTMTDGLGRGFVFGNVHNNSLIEALNNPRFVEIESAIVHGVKKCAGECAYFPVCGGGSPSNKFSETGRLDVSETKHCRLRFQALPEAVLSILEQELLQVAL